MQVMILAAGLGTRLRPHTRLRPKPLFPVLDRPLLLRNIDDLRRADLHPPDLHPPDLHRANLHRADLHRADLHRAGSRRILVNAFHLRQQIVDLLADQPDIEVQLEEMELGTGGGLRLARPWFADQPALVVNGDIFHNIDYGRVMEQHRRAGNDATLVLHDRPPHNKVRVDAEGNIISFKAPKIKPEPAGAASPLAFTGIQVIEPALLELIPPHGFYHSIDWYEQLIARGKKVRGMVVKGHFWSDMGTPQDYLALHAHLLTTPGQEPFFQGKEVNLGRGVDFADWVAVGSRATLGDGVQLRRCVVWDGVTVPAGTVARDTIFSGGS